MNNLIAPVSTRERRRKLNENIEKYFKEKKNEESNSQILNEAVSIAKTETTYNALNESLKKEKAVRDSFSVVNEEFDYNVKETLGNLFGMLVFESLPIDPEVKNLDARSIIENASDVFKTLYESNTVVLTQSPTFKDYAGSVVKQVENLSDRLSEEQIEDILETIFSDHHIDIGNTITNIYDKSANAIRTETKIKEFRGEEYDLEHISTNSNYVHENFTPTLFRYLNESKIENITKSEGIDKLRREDILNISLAESLTDYVILETLNTTKLVEFDMDSLKRRIRY